MLSKRIRERVTALTRIMDVLATRVESKGNIEYQKRRNAELQAQLLASQRDVARLNRRVDDLQRTLEEIRRYMVTDGSIPKFDKATSPLEKEESTKDAVVMRPPLKGVSVPIPSRKNRDVSNAEDVEITKQIVELVARRKQLRKNRQNNSSDRSIDPSPVTKDRGPKRQLPRVISNIQVAPPRESALSQQASQREIEEERSAVTDEWQEVESKTTRRKKVKIAKRQELQSPKNADQGKEKKGLRPPGNSQAKDNRSSQKRKPPRTAAIAIKDTKDGFSYASALRSLRGKIALPEPKIENSHIRKAANGGIIIEIPGEDRTKKADILKEKIAEVLGDSAKVTRPKIKGEVRLVGLDDSVVPDEVADTLAMAGGCLSGEVKVGAIRPMANGLYTVWACCPIGAAIKASSSGKIRIGWTVAKIELLKSRQVQCYKCWGKGHLRAQCVSNIDLSGACYRCGNEGHTAVTCQNVVACALCKLQGKPHEHRVGSQQCKPSDTLTQKTTQRREVTPMEIEIPGRRTDDVVSNDPDDSV